MKDIGSKLLVVIPAYNEAAGIARLIEDIDVALTRMQRPFEIIVVDDGSRDKTAETVVVASQNAPVLLVRHDTNKGLGMAIETGLRTALERAKSADIIVTMDADNSHVPGLIGAMEQKVWEGYDVVVASRFRPGARVLGVPFHRRLISRGASWFLMCLFPTPGIRDYTCGYRAYRVSALQKLQAEQGIDFSQKRGFECMVYLLLCLRQNGAVFCEVPMLLRYDQKIGSSKMNIGRTIRDTLRMLYNMRMSRHP